MHSSILIVNWETSHLLLRLLESLRAHPPSGKSETIVVDNASSDFDTQLFRKEFPDVTFLPQTSNAGFAAGNNLAYRHSAGERIVLLNPDTEVTPGAVDSLLGFLEDHPDTAIAAPQLVFPDGTIQSSCRGFPWPGSIFWAAVRFGHLFPFSRLFGAYRMTWFDHRRTMQVDQPMATCWAIRRRAIEQLGFFDEGFPNLFNDVDWAWRARQAGWRVWFVAEAQVKHVGGQATGKAGPRMHRESHRGLVRFYSKNMRGQSPAVAIWMATAISWINCTIRSALAQRGPDG